MTGAQTGRIYLAAEPGSLRLLAATDESDDGVVPCRVLAVSAPIAIAEAFRTGEPLWLGASAAVPLLGNDHRPIGVMSLEFGCEQDFDEGQRTFLRAIAKLTTRALIRAARHDEEREARSFQHRLIGIAGHELRNPLTVVISVSEQLARAAATDREVHAAGRLLRNARRMERVVRDLVDYAQAEAEGGLHVTPRPTDFHELCIRVLSSLASLHPERCVSYQRGGDGRGTWDPDRLEELLENLLVNAFKYGAPDQAVHLGWSVAGDELLVEVHNHGPPIPASLLPHIFDPFERGEAQARDGLGLGLYVVKQIVVAHRGRVEVRSDRESGTRFIVHLPCALPAIAADRSA